MARDPILGEISLSSGQEIRALLEQTSSNPAQFWQGVAPTLPDLLAHIEPGIRYPLGHAPIAVFRCDLDPITKVGALFNGSTLREELTSLRAIFEFKNGNDARSMIVYGFFWNTPSPTGDILNGALRSAQLPANLFFFQQPPPRQKMMVGFGGFEPAAAARLAALAGTAFEKLPLLIKAPYMCALGGLLGVVKPDEYQF